MKNLRLAAIIGTLGGVLLGTYEIASRPLVEAKVNPIVAYKDENQEEGSIEIREIVTKKATDKNKNHTMNDPIYIGIIERPKEEYTTSSQKFSTWNLFDGSHDNPKDFIKHRMSLDLTVIEPETRTGLAQKVIGVAKKHLWRKTKTILKKEWKRKYKASNMPQKEYIEIKNQIESIGKDNIEAQNVDDVYNQEAQEEILQNDDRNQIPLLSWGPATFYDTGNIGFDLGFLASQRDLEGLEDVKVGEDNNIPWVISDAYKITTDFTCPLRLDRLISSGNVLDTIPSFDLRFGIYSLTKVLGKEKHGFEAEVEVDKNYKEVSAFFNFVIRSR